MKLYLTVIGFAMMAISAVNIAFGTTVWYQIIIGVVVCTALQFALDGWIAIIVHKLPDRWFGIDNPHYAVSGWEKKLYRKLKVRKWKDKVWELGGIGGFSKKSLAAPNSPEYIEKFMIECNKGVLTHRLSYLIGFVPMLWLPNECAFSVALPVGAVNLFLNVLPTLALRYNTPKLKLVLERMKKRQRRSV